MIRRLCPSLSSDVVAMARGAILWDEHDDLDDDDPGPPPWWCRIAVAAEEGEPCPGVTMEGG